MVATVEEAVENAKTPADHEAIAAYFDEQIQVLKVPVRVAVTRLAEQFPDLGMRPR